MPMWRMRIACWGYKHKFITYNTHCFSTLTMVARTQLNVTSHIQRLYCSSFSPVLSQWLCCRLDTPRNLGSTAGKTKDLSLLKTRLDLWPSYSIGTGGHLLEVKRLGSEAKSTPTVPKLRMSGAIHGLSPHAFIPCTGTILSGTPSYKAMKPIRGEINGQTCSSPCTLLVHLHSTPPLGFRGLF